jgi:hypothetical protein
VQNQKVTNKALQEGLDKLSTTVFEIISRGKSQWVKEGTGPEHGTPAQHLSTNRTMMLNPDSRLYLGKGNGYMPTLYVAGADTHYVNDFYEDKEGRLVVERLTPDQAKNKGYTSRRGLRSQGYDLSEEYRKSMDLGICFEFGQLDVRKWGDDPLLLRFVEEHEQNENAPRAKENRDAKRLKLFQFRPSVPEMEAAKSDNVVKFDADLEALQLVAKTRTKGGNNSYVYHEEWLNAILSIVEDGKTLGAGEVIQKFDLVAQWARHDGAEFIRIINNAFDEAKMDIQLAEQLKVINFGGKEVKFVDGGGKTIMEFKKDTAEKEALVEELMLFLIGSTEGQLHYSEIARLTEVAKLGALKAD